MRGYRCDNCRDFAPEQRHDGVSVFSGRAATSAPEGWMVLADGSDASHHFCSGACLVAFAEAHASDVSPLEPA